MNFADPVWFFMLVPVSAWFVWEILRGDRHRESLPFSGTVVLKAKTRKHFAGEKVLPYIKFAGLVLAVIALARPQSVSVSKEPPKPVLDIYMCLDTSMSMSALDFDPDNRLDAAKKAAAEFIRKRPFDRIGLVVFGGRAITQCPLTLDHETLIDFLKQVPMNATQTDGTAVGSAIALASIRLAESEAKSKAIILLTDGRSNTGNIDPVTAALSAADLGIKIYTIGTAVPGGGLIPVDHPVLGRQLVKAAEDLDESSLQAVARATSAKYFRVTSGRRFREIYAEIDRMETTKVEISTVQNFQDRYLTFLIAGFALVIIEIFVRRILIWSVP